VKLLALAAGALLAVTASTPAAHAESIMDPIDDHGQIVDDHMPFAQFATPDKKIEWLRRQGTAHCPDTSYTPEHRSIGLVCVRR